MEYSFTNVWLPLGFSYWEQGNWQSTGTKTSGSNDYISNALPQSGKYYWETIINDPGTHRILGISAGGAGAGTEYTDNIFGYYYNQATPLYLTMNSSGTPRGSGDNGGAGIAEHGTNNPFEWVNGKRLMWALDADDDKIWFGYEGSWVESADPANGTNPTILGEDLSATSFYFKIGYSDGGGSLSLTNVSGTSTPHLLTSVADMKIDATAFQSTTATPYITPTLSSVARVTSPEINKAHVLEFPPTKAALLHKGKRPSYGLQYPRGYYNK